VSLAWRKAEMGDAELLWRWANDRETRENSFSSEPIAYADHMAWLERRLASDRTRFWIFSDAGVPVGHVRFDLTGQVAEIGITVAPERRGRGYGKALLAQALRCLRDEMGDGVRPRASVLAHNTASLRLFAACGFAPVAGDGARGIVLEQTANGPREAA
jgi:RimJ/RimL family protein N-acetyltransferase